MLRVTDISKKVKQFSLRNINISVEKGEYFILLGVSGAGKSMLLEMIAGLERPDSGSIILDGREITHEKIQSRGTGILFQDFAVFPHLTVQENIAYSLHHKKNHAEKKKLIAETAETLSITSLLPRHPMNLSGGELQRVALARTLVNEPKILLLDEPLSAVDTLLKADLRSLLKRIHRNGMTILHVTHDYEEALALGSRIAVIHDGEIIQTGTPDEVFGNPRSEFVAHFTGAKNFYPASFVNDNGAFMARLTPEVSVQVSRAGAASGYILIRSEDVILSRKPFESSATNNFKGNVLECNRVRNGFEIYLDIGVRLYATITDQSFGNLQIHEGSPLWVHFKATAVRVIEK